MANAPCFTTEKQPEIDVLDGALDHPSPNLLEERSPELFTNRHGSWMGPNATHLHMARTSKITF